MSELDEIKKLITKLSEGESKKARLQEELNSTQRKLDGLHSEIQKAEHRLALIKEEAETIRLDAIKAAEKLVNDANAEKAEATKKLAEAAKIERNAQAKLSDAESTNQAYQSMLADVTAQKEKLRAALV